MRKFVAIIMIALATAYALSGAAQAAPCAGFIDVEDSSGFCECRVDEEPGHHFWLHGHRVLPVSRLAMAAFMNRLGTAPTAGHIRVDTAQGAITRPP